MRRKASVTDMQELLQDKESSRTRQVIQVSELSHRGSNTTLINILWDLV